MSETKRRFPVEGGAQGGPKFVMGGGGGLMQLVPPFDFQGVTMRTFPLRASLPRLASFVDSYLNIVPREVGYFKPLVPYVYLMIINYGKMAVEAANMGWIAQNEIAFSIPLEWYKEVDGKLVFHDFAYVSPFIYVDNDLSMTTGREVYGWPKSLISITPETTSWMLNPRSPAHMATVSSMVFPELYAGSRQVERPLLQIDQAAAPSFTQLPPDPQSPLFPWVSIPNAIKSSAGLLADVGRVATALGLTRKPKGPATPGAPDGLPISEGGTLGGMMKQLGGMLNPYNPNIYFNTINLKQFRDSTLPGAFCYQAVTNAVMSLVKMNGFGLLGDAQMALGDITGGYRIALQQWPTHPITDALGITVAKQTQGDGVTIAELEPVCPMWMDVDMRYGRGDALAWRARGQSWHCPPAKAGGPPRPLAEPAPMTPVQKAMDERYNTSLGTSLDLTGPFDFPATTVRVLPLLAQHEKLQALCDDLLNRPLDGMGQRFEAWGQYVYLLATSYEEMASLSNNIGSWAENDVTFLVPVKWFETVDGKEVLTSIVMLPVFSFADGTTVAITRSEVSGIPTQKASITSPPDSWMEDAGPSDGTARRVLDVTAQVLPVIGMGQPTADRTLIRVTLNEDVLPYNDHVRWRFVAEGWGKEIVEEHDRKREARAHVGQEIEDLKALGAGLLTGQFPLRLLTLKQFRNASEPMNACYQSVTEIDRRIERVFDLREIDARVLVRVERYESCPIVQRLGLVPKWTEYNGATQVDVLQAMRPFWAKIALHETLGRRHFWRSTGQTEWQVAQDEAERHPDSVLSPDAKRPDVGRSLVKRIEAARPQRIFDHVHKWRETAKDGDRISAEQARNAILRAEPQLALESILSNEWEHWGNPLWYRAYLEIEHQFTEHVRGATPGGKRALELKVAKEAIGHVSDLIDVGRPHVAAEVLARVERGRVLVDLIGRLSNLYADQEKRANKDPSAPTQAHLDKEINAWFADLERALRSDDFVQGQTLDPAMKRKDLAGLTAMMEMLRKVWSDGKEALMILFSKIAQKPELFLRRDLLGTEQYRLPKEQACGPDRVWFVGPELAHAHKAAAAAGIPTE